MKPLRRIFSIVPDCHTPSGYYRVLWKRHFSDGIRPQVETLVTPTAIDFSWARKGHDIPLDPKGEDRLRTSELLWKQIKSAHDEHGLDAVISYCYSHDIEEDLVRQTIQLGVPWVNFYCDSTHMFEKVERLARIVSLNWFPESAAVANYKALGVPHFCRAFAMNPEFLPDLQCQTPTNPVAFIGLPTSNRITLLGWLRLFGCQTVIRGNGWIGGGANPFYNPAPPSRRFLRAISQPNFFEKVFRRLLWPMVQGMAAGPLDDREFDAFVRESLVVLGLNQGKDAQGRFASYLKFRDVEFPGYGCCYLTEHNQDVERVFEVGKEVLTYRGMREAAAQAKGVKKEPKLAASIGQAARKRVLGEHIWANRLRELAERL